MLRRVDSPRPEWPVDADERTLLCAEGPALEHRPRTPSSACPAARESAWSVLRSRRDVAGTCSANWTALCRRAYAALGGMPTTPLIMFEMFEVRRGAREGLVSWVTGAQKGRALAMQLKGHA